ncbi:hypothetical protein LC092_05280 [Stappia stellulata]|uniref:hypothetical protein n=1 Tax=Stappia stellulata TaxID=71235 RepID=UPI001CD55141|nr:hypothetical protein [Stappia stellulata]MCA1241839.1 hypothetical protein [Stappia stellulata]
MLLDAITLALKVFVYLVFALLVVTPVVSLVAANFRLWRGHREDNSLADAPAGSWQGLPFDRMDAALVKPFVHDLEDMTPERIREEWRDVQEKLQELESWSEALHAWARLRNIDLNGGQ